MASVRLQMGHAERTDPWAWPAARLAEAIARKELSAVEVVEGVLARIERLDGPLNAFCTLTAESARAEARRAERAVTPVVRCAGRGRRERDAGRASRPRPGRLHPTLRDRLPLTRA